MMVNGMKIVLENQRLIMECMQLLLRHNTDVSREEASSMIERLKKANDDTLGRLVIG